MIHFIIPISASSQQHGTRWNRYSRKPYSDPKKKAYIASLIAECGHHAPPAPLTGCLEVQYIFHLEDPAGEHSGLAEDSPNDGDNLQKSVQDGLSKAKFWRNDKLIVHWDGWKLWSDKELFPRVEICIRSINKNFRPVSWAKKP